MAATGSCDADAVAASLAAAAGDRANVERALRRLGDGAASSLDDPVVLRALVLLRLAAEAHP